MQISSWGHYFTNVNGALASVALDRSLRPKVPMDSRPHLLWVKVQLRSPKPNGLSDRGELASPRDHRGRFAQRAEGCLSSRRGRAHHHRRAAGALLLRRRRQRLPGRCLGGDAEIQCVQVRHGKQGRPGVAPVPGRALPHGRGFSENVEHGRSRRPARAGDTLRPAREVRHWIYFGTPTDRQCACCQGESARLQESDPRRTAPKTAPSASSSRATKASPRIKSTAL